MRRIQDKVEPSISYSLSDITMIMMWCIYQSLDHVSHDHDTFVPEGVIEGEEDCLYLDLVVPGGVKNVDSADGKAVMVWIHGGAYAWGHRMQYIPAPLAASGDVIVVTVNYRLGVFGFLYTGPGGLNW